ncbi:MAG: metallophosphoesterase [Acidimicrobiia bacterium]
MTTVEHAELISVGPTEVVVTFTSEPGALVATRVGDREVTTTGPHHVVRIGDLSPDTEHELEVEGSPSDEPWLPATVRTLAQPRGRLLATIATANDVHFGETECGRTGDPATDAIGPILRAQPGDPPYPEVMNRAVVTEMARLDPDAVVVKGDLTDTGRAEEYEAFLSVYEELGPRMRHVRGNHDAMRDPTLAAQDTPYAIELPGVTLGVLDTTLPGAVGGVLPAAQVSWLDDLAGAVTGPLLVFGHHPVWNVEAARVDSRYAIARDESLALVALIARHENIVGYFAGHTHTNRVVRLGGGRSVPLVEVACTKDYPGAWAEYRVYEGGYTQVVRRVTEPAAFAWAERARTMIQGIYRDLVLGSVQSRCFTQHF